MKYIWKLIQNNRMQTPSQQPSHPCDTRPVDDPPTCPPLYPLSLLILRRDLFQPPIFHSPGQPIFFPISILFYPVGYRPP